MSSGMFTLDLDYAANKEMWEIPYTSKLQPSSPCLSFPFLRALNCSTAKRRNKILNYCMYTELFWTLFFLERDELKYSFEAELDWDLCTDLGESATFWMWMGLRRRASARAGFSLPVWTIWPCSDRTKWYNDNDNYRNIMFLNKMKT